MTPPPPGATPPFASVWFDCDSTLSAIEGIDELVDALPAAAQRALRQLTQAAMDGTAELATVYPARLQAIAPHRDRLREVGRRYVERVVPDAGDVVGALRWLGKQVGVVSGGLLDPVRHLAEHLGVDPACVHAVPLRFAADGSYLDFDRSCPLWRNGGKVEVLRSLPAASHPLCFVGDGATDLEVQGTAADLFVGFGGVAARAPVQAAAQAWIGAPGLAPLLPLVLTADELRRLGETPRFAPLLSRARG